MSGTAVWTGRCKAMTYFELDHVFICTDIGAPEADRLRDFGLTEGAPNVHPGQGTANRRFFFHNAMLELLWVHTPKEAQSAACRPTRLWERWNGRHSAALPFGICLRPQHSPMAALPFSAWAYTPTYLPSPAVIHVGENSASLAEPMLFYVAFGCRPDQASSRYPLEHATGFREMTSLQIQCPQSGPPSAALRAVVDMGIVIVRIGTPALMELGFDGETCGQSMDFRPGLPLVLHW
jgi:Glyoxalase-like domain